MKHKNNTIRSCVASDLIISDNGLQCGNCLAYEGEAIYTKIQKPDCDWFHLSDGKNIIYCQPIKYEDEYYMITSVHKPNRKVGTGYRLSDYTKLSREVIENFLSVSVPNWADKSDYKEVVKYKNLEEFIEYQKQFFSDIILSDFKIK